KLDQQLIESLISFIVPHNAHGALASYRIQFVEKNHTGCRLTSLVEEVSHPLCTDTYKHFDKFGCAQTEERNPGFTGHCLCQESFPGSRRSYEQRTSRNMRSQT